MLDTPEILQQLTVIQDGTIITLMTFEDTPPGVVEIHIGTDKGWTGRRISHNELLKILLSYVKEGYESTVPA